MAETDPPDDRLFATRWVHVFEEDLTDGAVYRPDTGDMPLSRRPRERLEFDPDGAARLLVGGPDDRMVSRATTWCDDTSRPVTRPPEDTEVRIVHRSADRLLVRIRGTR